MTSFVRIVSDSERYIASVTPIAVRCKTSPHAQVRGPVRRAATAAYTPHVEPRQGTALRRLASTRARLVLLIVATALVSLVALALLHSPHGVAASPSEIVATDGGGHATHTVAGHGDMTPDEGFAAIAGMVTSGGLDASLTADCASCGPSDSGIAVACAMMLLLIAILALPFVSRTRVVTRTPQAVVRQRVRSPRLPAAPDLTSLCISRT